MNINIINDFNGYVGINKISTPQWEGCIYLIDSVLFKSSNQPSFIECVGVYIIYGDYFDKKRNKAAVYIGEGDNVKTRLHSHYKNKGFWNKALVFTHPNLNVAMTKKIEGKFIKLAKLASRYEVDNKNKGTTVSNVDVGFTGEFIEKSKNILELANLDIFKLNEDAVYTCDRCKIRKTSNGYEILQGSIIEASIYKTQSPKQERFPFVKKLSNEKQISVLTNDPNSYVQIQTIKIETPLNLNRDELCLLMNREPMAVGLMFKSITNAYLWDLKDNQQLNEIQQLTGSNLG